MAPCGLGIGLAVGLGPPPGGAGAPPSNPNLLLWTEEFENPIWTLTNGDILATDQDGTADEFGSDAPAAAIRQISQTAAASGGPHTSSASMAGTLTRSSVSGAFDGVSYTFSVKLKDTGLAAVPVVTLRMDRSGGFIRCSIEDSVGDGDFIVGYAQLEQAAAFTSYVRRGGS